MSSLRLPQDLLDRLHEAMPPGRSLAATVERALALAGGPARVREDLVAEDRRAQARAQVARLRRLGHASVCLAPDHQQGLAQAAAAWVGRLEAEGLRRYDDASRSLFLGSAPQPDQRSADRLQLSRGGRSL